MYCRKCHNSVPSIRGFIARARRVFNIELHIAREKNKLLFHFQKWEKLTNALCSTVKPLLTDTSIIRTPLYYGQFVLSQKCQKSYIPYLYNTATSVKRTLSSVPLVSVLIWRGLTVVDTHRFVKISRHLYCYRRCCIVILFLFFFFFQVKLYNLIHLINFYS